MTSSTKNDKTCKSELDVIFGELWTALVSPRSVRNVNNREWRFVVNLPEDGVSGMCDRPSNPPTGANPLQCQCKICHNSQNGILIVKIASNFSQNLRSKTDSEMWKIYIDIHLFERYIRAKDSNWIQSKHSTLRVCWKKTNGMLMLQFLICI